MRSLIFILFFNITTILGAQSFEVSVSSDSVLYGNYVEVHFTMENLDGEFEAPDMSEFIILSGPNVSSTMQIINGKMSSQKSYSFFIKPKEIGSHYFKPAYLITHEKTYETKPLEINVFHNPEGLEIIPEPRQRNFNFEFPFPDSYDKKENEIQKPKKPLKRI